MSKKIVLSAIQPSGELHLGNYFGAIKNWVRLQNEGEYKCIYGAVDLHVMTMPYEPEVLKKNTEQMMIDFLACGVDPDKSILFIQSLVPEHTELTWIFNCICSFGDLTRQTQFKDKSDQINEKQTGDKFISAGLFTYPVLQVADILAYRANFVPVGKDQEQHLELSRTIAERFNSRFGELFPEPQVLFTETPKIYSLADPAKKMSKSLGEKHIIGLFEEEDSLRKKVRSAVTDSGETTGEMSAGVANLFELLKACGKTEIALSLMEDYTAGNLKYSLLKDALGDALVELTGEFRKRREEFVKDRKGAMKQVHKSSEKARDLAGETLKEVRKLCGLPKR
ncbi:MAG TPA: tryptophan--tRNA ligase [Pyrinomonadaceae bacterium]|jgi:tryptophanyl-tRNA synthetase